MKGLFSFLFLVKFSTNILAQKQIKDHTVQDFEFDGFEQRSVESLFENLEYSRIKSAKNRSTLVGKSNNNSEERFKVKTNASKDRTIAKLDVIINQTRYVIKYTIVRENLVSYKCIGSTRDVENSSHQGVRLSLSPLRLANVNGVLLGKVYSEKNIHVKDKLVRKLSRQTDNISWNTSENKVVYDGPPIFLFPKYSNK